MPIGFYLKYAFRNLRRSGRWSIFAIFCVAAGVATVVALRSLGLAIADSLVANVRASNHGDINMVRGSDGFFGGNAFEEDRLTNFSDSDLERIRSEVNERGGDMTAYIRYGSFQVTRVDSTSAGRPQFASAFFIDPATFPPDTDIRAIDPAGVSLRDLLTDGDQIVISQNLAEAEGVAVGDDVRVSGTEDPFIVTGIVATDTEAGIRNLFASFFGFAYVHIDHAERLQIPPQPNTVAITLPAGQDIQAVGDRLDRIFRNTRVNTLPRLLEINSEIGDYIGRFIVVMGLGALLIGGVGIINTMLVMVGRRTAEIATLKTFGLKGRQVVALFMAEAFLLGLAGSIAGTILGVLLAGVVNQYGETFLQQTLVWRLYPEALVYGLGLGMVVTLVFGIVPVLTANRVRPATILRPNETVIPGVGCLHSLLAIVLVVLVIGGLAGQILGIIWVGFVGVALTLVIMGLLVGIFWVIVWLVSRLPSFGWVDLRLALRNMTARRLRTATTLLALSAGMFALSIITFVGAGTREILQFQLENELGGNVMVFPTANLLSPEIGQTLLRAQLQRVEGVENATALAFYNVDLVAVDGEEPTAELPFFIDENELSEGERRDFLDPQISVTTQESANPNSQRDITSGRDLTEADRGQRVIVLSKNDRHLENTVVGVGSIITVRLNGEAVDFEVVGIMGEDDAFGFGPGASVVPPETLDGVRPDMMMNVLQIAPEHLNQALLDLTAFVPPVFTLDISFIDGLIGRFIEQFSAIPTVVGLLSLLAAAVIMVNTVSLATLERRRQIGVLKAVGLKGRRVLLIMLLENTLIGFLGGALGIGLSALAVAIMTSLGMGDALPVPRDASMTVVALLVASVVIAWIATFASARVAVGERVTNVLRYE
jgi:predicted lysophospholipase L1 biosynthesis ABC-type transport system permease subunit